MMKIEVWFDFTCPFCYIGKRTLEEALTQFHHKNNIQIQYKSYRLDPNTRRDDNDTIGNMLNKRLGISQQKLQNIASDIYDQAERLNVVLHLEKMKSSNTLLAHRLAKYAAVHAKDNEIINLLFEGYFTNTINIECKQDLLQIAKQVGLHEDKVDAILSLNKYKKSVLEDESLAEEIGIHNIPCYIFNEEHAITGTHSIELLSLMLEELWNKEKHFSTEEQDETTFCTGEDCENK